MYHLLALCCDLELRGARRAPAIDGNAKRNGLCTRLYCLNEKVPMSSVSLGGVFAALAFGFAFNVSPNARPPTPRQVRSLYIIIVVFG